MYVEAGIAQADGLCPKLKNEPISIYKPYVHKQSFPNITLEHVQFT